MVVSKVYKNDENGDEIKLYEKHIDAVMYAHEHNMAILNNKSIPDEDAKQLILMTEDDV